MSHAVASTNSKFTLKQRIIILFLMWLVVGLAFAFAPVEPSGYPEDDELWRAFLYAPITFAFGLVALLSLSNASDTTNLLWMVTVFALVLTYACVLLSWFLTEAKRRPILVFCAVHVVLTAISVFGFVRWNWRMAAG